MRELAGRVAVVTGGASGVGKAMGAVFAREGMRVVLADIEKSALDATVAALASDDRAVTGVVVDVASQASVEALADQVYAAHGAVHLLCNNAGVGLGEAQRRVWTLPPEDWQWGLGVNLWGVIHGIRAFVPRMLEAGEEGRVVNTSSGNGGLHINPTTPIYSATKAAMTSLTETLHYQFLMDDAKLGASLLFPGPHLVNTRILAAARNRPAEYAGSESEPLMYTSMEELAKSSRVAFQLTEPEEVAELALEGIRAGRFWILPESEAGDERVRARMEGILARRNPVLPD